MCHVFAGQDAAGYAAVKRSVRIGGHSTSIQLEAAFWDLLDAIAAEEGLATAEFMSQLYDEAVELRGEVTNFASMLRTTCLLHLRGARGRADAAPVAPAPPAPAPLAARAAGCDDAWRRSGLKPRAASGLTVERARRAM